ncbi:MAG: AIR synthase related protein [Ignisphaera sp.]
MGKLDEIVKKLARGAKRHPRSLLTWFDDAGAVEINGRYFVVKADGFASSRALYPWCSYRDFGFRGVAGAVSDVIAKGCRPYVYAISIGVKPENVDFIEDIIKGVEEAVDIFGGYIENIDTNIGYDDWIDVFVLGECLYYPLPRGARELSKVILPRRVGLSVMAYMEYVEKRTPSIDEVRKFSCRPMPYTRIVDAIEFSRTGLEGSIDISDTFAEALQQLSEVSGTGVYIQESPSRILHPLAIEYVKRVGLDLQLAVLASNEEYIPLLIVKPGYEEEVLDVLKSISLEPVVIGTITLKQDLMWMGRVMPKVVWDYIQGAVTI